MRKLQKQKLALALVLVMMFIGASPAFALSDGDIHMKVLENAKTERDRVELTGNYSGEHLNQSIIDITYLNQNTVTSYTYTGDNQNLVINTHNINSQTISSVRNKLTRFVFQIRNMYYPHNAVSISGIEQDINTVRTWTYGPDKDKTMFAIVNGLRECLNNEPIMSNYSDGFSDNDIWIEKYLPENIDALMQNDQNKNKTISSSDKKVSKNITTQGYYLDDEEKNKLFWIFKIHTPEWLINFLILKFIT